MSERKPRQPDTREIDLEEVARLIDALERDLSRVQGNFFFNDTANTEIYTLKNVLRSPVRRHHWVRDALHDIRDAAVAEGIEVGRYVAEIGRILGL